MEGLCKMCGRNYSRMQHSSSFLSYATQMPKLLCVIWRLIRFHNLITGTSSLLLKLIHNTTPRSLTSPTFKALAPNICEVFLGADIFAQCSLWLTFSG